MTSDFAMSSLVAAATMPIKTPQRKNTVLMSAIISRQRTGGSLDFEAHIGHAKMIQSGNAMITEIIDVRKITSSAFI
jgi:hypothetical protein